MLASKNEAKILDALYEAGIITATIDGTKHVVSFTKTPKRFKRTNLLARLADKKLVEYVGRGSNWVQLTDDGQVTIMEHYREKHKEELLQKRLQSLRMLHAKGST